MTVSLEYNTGTMYTTPLHAFITDKDFIYELLGVMALSLLGGLFLSWLVYQLLRKYSPISSAMVRVVVTAAIVVLLIVVLGIVTQAMGI